MAYAFIWLISVYSFNCTVLEEGRVVPIFYVLLVDWFFLNTCFIDYNDWDNLPYTFLAGTI